MFYTNGLKFVPFVEKEQNGMIAVGFSVRDLSGNLYGDPEFAVQWQEFPPGTPLNLCWMVANTLALKASGGQGGGVLVPIYA